jgi:hypothetical protein
LKHPFFDPNFMPEELRPRMRRRRLRFEDAIMLFARLVWIFRAKDEAEMWMESAWEKLERLAVRNWCLDEPFFDRERDPRVGGRDERGRLFEDGEEDAEHDGEDLEQEEGGDVSEDVEMGGGKEDEDENMDVDEEEAGYGGGTGGSW